MRFLSLYVTSRRGGYLNQVAVVCCASLTGELNVKFKTIAAYTSQHCHIASQCQTIDAINLNLGFLGWWLLQAMYALQLKLCKALVQQVGIELEEVVAEDWVSKVQEDGTAMLLQNINSLGYRRNEASSRPSPLPAGVQQLLLLIVSMTLDV